MATEELFPDGVTFTLGNLTGAYTDINEDADAPNGVWLAASSNNANSTVVTSFATPTGSPNTGTGLQTFKIYARITPNGSACDYNVYLSESGTRLNGGTAIASGSLTSLTGELITATWDAALLGVTDGSGVECDFEVVKSGVHLVQEQLVKLMLLNGMLIIP